MSSNHERVGHIDAWRFIAVSLVLVGHVVVFSNLQLADQWPTLRRVGRFGTLGVLIFFVISGFVICRSLLRERTVNVRAFYIRRAFRILPPLWLFLLALLGLQYIGWIDVSRRQILFASLFACNLNLNCSWYAGHTWSLAYEEQFYLLFPLLFVLLQRVGHIRRIVWIYGICAAIAVGARAAGGQLLPDYLMHFSFLLAGCAAAVHEKKVNSLVARLRLPHWAALVALLVLSVGLLPHAQETYARTVLYPPLIVLLLLGTPLSNRMLASFFTSRGVQYLGLISYTVYLWQQLATGLWPGMPAWGTPALVGAVWLWAHVSWKYIEAPLVAIGTRLSNRVRAPAVGDKRGLIREVRIK